MISMYRMGKKQTTALWPLQPNFWWIIAHRTYTASHIKEMLNDLVTLTFDLSIVQIFCKWLQ